VNVLVKHRVSETFILKDNTQGKRNILSLEYSLIVAATKLFHHFEFVTTSKQREAIEILYKMFCEKLDLVFTKSMQILTKCATS